MADKLEGEERTEALSGLEGWSEVEGRDAKGTGHVSRSIPPAEGSWHVGDPPDPRAVAAAAARGIDLSDLRARRVSPGDFTEFDLLLAMDDANHAALLSGAPHECADKVRMFLGDAPELGREVPDPYYGGGQGFEDVLDLVEAGSKALLARLV